MIDSAKQKDHVRAFWQRQPCGSQHAQAPEGSAEFFSQVERTRYELEPFIARYAAFEESAGQEVLEIGVGLGTDFVRFARSGARVTGVDLTERAIELVGKRLRLEGLDGSLLVADAEELPFDDASFDLVYSWGVLHHTPDARRAVREAIRVLRPGGRLCVMLYSRRSWVAYALWTRHALLRGKPLRSLRDVIAGHLESDGTKAYTKVELRRLLEPLDDVRIEKVATPYDRRVAGPLAGWTGRWLGWFSVVEGRKHTRVGSVSERQD